MKKTFTINISGTLFHIEEDAYEKLQGYLVKLKNHFGGSQEGREIVADIEMRIAELFTEKGKGEHKVIVSEWVDEVISTMGMPEDFEAQEGEKTSPAGITRRKRRLYRSGDNRVFAGVCSGLAQYFRIDPLVMRILFVVLFFANGVGLLAYLILWIAVPRAQTTSQKLEMRGEEVTISNIERSVKEEPQAAGTGSAPEAVASSLASQPAAPRQGDRSPDIARSLLRIIAVTFGIFLMLAGFLGLLGFISTVVVGQTFLADWPVMWNPDLPFNGLLSQFITPSGAAWGLFFLALLAGIPLLAMLYIGTKLVFRYRSNNTAIGLIMVGLWLVGLVGLVSVSAREAGNFKSTSTLSGSETLYPTPGKTLRLQIAESRFDDFDELSWDLPRSKAVMADDKIILLGEPRLDIEKSATSDFILVIKKQSRGRTQQDASENIRSIVYQYQLTDTTLTLDPWFLLGDDAKWRNQRLDLTLKVPEGAAVFLSEGLEEIIWDIENVTNTWDREMIGKSWIMLPEGLTMKDAPASAADSVTQTAPADTLREATSSESLN